MNEQNDRDDKPLKTSSRDKWIKIGFVAVLVVAGAFVWMQSRRDPALKGWLTDYDAAVREAKNNNTRTLIIRDFIAFINASFCNRLMWFFFFIKLI